MAFTSFSFLVFLPIALLIYFLVPIRARMYWLLIVSMAFYAFSGPIYLVFLTGSVIITYIAGRLLEKAQGNVSYKNLIVALTVILNLGCLGFFKYFDFVTDSLNKVLNTQIGALNLIAPLGISFYTFQVIGYIVDVYRGREAERNIAKYALFASFFPSVASGPIDRDGHLLKQIEEMRTKSLVSWDKIKSGALTMVYGYILKLIVADRVALYVNTIYHPDNWVFFKGFLVALAAILYSVEIYCDFAGYTYIAIGMSRMMGIELLENFNAPYLTTNIKGFWDGWHISLTKWFTRYLYIPLGGSKKGTIRKYVNIFIVFLLSGLWHGAAWHFVMWGVLHGIVRILWEVFAPLWQKLCDKLKFNTQAFSAKLLAGVGNFFVVSILWMFFRGNSVRNVVSMIKNMITGFKFSQLFDREYLNFGMDARDWNVVIVFVALMLVVDICKKKNVDLKEALLKQNAWCYGAVLVVAIISIVVFGMYGPAFDSTAFIYFKF